MKSKAKSNRSLKDRLLVPVFGGGFLLGLLILSPPIALLFVATIAVAVVVMSAWQEYSKPR